MSISFSLSFSSIALVAALAAAVVLAKYFD
jgi:hypothetical protein